MARAPSWPGHAARGLFVLHAREEDVQEFGPSWICAATHTGWHRRGAPQELKTCGLPRRCFPCLHPQPLASCSAKPHRGGFLIRRADFGSVYTDAVTPIRFMTPEEITNASGGEDYKPVIWLLGAGSVVGFPF